MTSSHLQDVQKRLHLVPPAQAELVEVYAFPPPAGQVDCVVEAVDGAAEGSHRLLEAPVAADTEGVYQALYFILLS